MREGWYTAIDREGFVESVFFNGDVFLISSGDDDPIEFPADYFDGWELTHEEDEAWRKCIN